MIPGLALSWERVFISHDLPLVHLVADQVAVMHRGKFVETGPADDSYTDPQHDYTRTLLSVSAIAAPTPGEGIHPI